MIMGIVNRYSQESAGERKIQSHEVHPVLIQFRHFLKPIIWDERRMHFVGQTRSYAVCIWGANHRGIERMKGERFAVNFKDGYEGLRLQWRRHHAGNEGGNSDLSFMDGPVLVVPGQVQLV